MQALKFLYPLLVGIAMAGRAAAQEFHPYPDAKITEAQWQSYLAEVRAKVGQSERAFPDDHLIVFEDKLRQTYYSFTMSGHPAHPAWVARRVYDAAGVAGTEQTGYYAGDRVPFEALYEAYRDLTLRMQGEDDGELPPEANSPEAKARVEELTLDFLFARDSADFARAYAMLEPVAQRASPFGDWRGWLADNLARSGKPQGHDIRKLRWYQDPGQGRLPGIYVAIDLGCHYENLAVCSEQLTFHRGTDGEFHVARYEQNILETSTMLEMCRTRERLSIGLSGGGQVEVSCPR